MVLCMSTKIYKTPYMQVCPNVNNPNTKTTHTSMVCWDSLFLDSDLGHSGFSAICHGDTPNNPLKLFSSPQFLAGQTSTCHAIGL